LLQARDGWFYGTTRDGGVRGNGTAFKMTSGGALTTLLEFAGCVLVISHDRWFLDRVATHILACEGDSKWTFFDGNYQEYEADKKKRLGEEGAKPKRIRYKPIAR